MDEKQYTDLAVKVEGIDARSRSNEHRIDDLEADMKETHDMQKTLIKLADGIEVMGNQLGDVKQDLKDVKSGQKDLSDKVTILENKPATETKNKLDAIRDKATWVIVAGVLGYVLGHLLPSVF